MVHGSAPRRDHAATRNTLELWPGESGELLSPLGLLEIHLGNTTERLPDTEDNAYGGYYLVLVR